MLKCDTIINIILYGITFIYRHFYILPLYYCKNNFAMLFLQWGRGERQFFLRGSNLPKNSPSHKEKNSKKTPI